MPELELRDAYGNPVAEADLIAADNDEVIVAEAKSNDALGKNPREVKRAAAKRVVNSAGPHRGDPLPGRRLARPQGRRAQPRLPRLVKWRTGCEGRISCLKRGYSWDRTLLDGKSGAAIWCDMGYSPTTWSRSALWRPSRTQPSDFFRSKY